MCFFGELYSIPRAPLTPREGRAGLYVGLTLHDPRLGVYQNLCLGFRVQGRFHT